MKLKLVLAAALFVSTGTFVAQAQQKPTVSATAASSAKSFQKKINLFKNEPDATKSASIFQDINVDMRNGVASAKTETAQNTSQAQKTASLNKTTARMTAMNDAVTKFKASPSDKASVIAALTQYAQTL